MSYVYTSTTLSKLKVVDSNFLFHLFSFILFLELGLGLK